MLPASRIAPPDTSNARSPETPGRFDLGSSVRVQTILGRGPTPSRRSRQATAGSRFACAVSGQLVAMDNERAARCPPGRTRGLGEPDARPARRVGRVSRPDATTGTAMVADRFRLDLDVTLHRIVEAARELDWCPIRSVGYSRFQRHFRVLRPRGNRLWTAQKLGELPVGDGLRIDDMAVHPLTVGLHAEGLPMRLCWHTNRPAGGGLRISTSPTTGPTSVLESQQSAGAALATAAAAAIDNASTL